MILDLVLFGGDQHDFHTRLVSRGHARPNNLVIQIHFGQFERNVLLGIELDRTLDLFRSHRRNHNPLHDNRVSRNAGGHAFGLELRREKRPFDGVGNRRRIHNRPVDNNVRPQALIGEARELVASFGFRQFYGFDRT